MPRSNEGMKWRGRLTTFVLLCTAALALSTAPPALASEQIASFNSELIETKSSTQKSRKPEAIQISKPPLRSRIPERRNPLRM